MMQRSESIKNLMAALMAVQKEQVVIAKDAKGRFQYASLDSAVTKATPILHRHGLTVAQPYDNTNGAPCITTILCHVDSGEFIISDFPFDRAGMQSVNDAQDYMGGSSYARRYAYLGSIGWVPGGDDRDGEQQRSNKGNGKPAKNAAPKEIPGEALDFEILCQNAKTAADATALFKEWGPRARAGDWADYAGALWRGMQKKFPELS